MLDLDDFSVCAATQAFMVSATLSSLHGNCSDKIFRVNQQRPFEVYLQRYRDIHSET